MEKYVERRNVAPKTQTTKAMILKEIWLWTAATLVAIPVALVLSPFAFALGSGLRLLVDWL